MVDEPHNVTIGPLRVQVEYDPVSLARTSRVVAYRAKCSCGWRGPSWATYANASFDGQAHRRSEAS